MEATETNEKIDSSFSDFLVIIIYQLASYLSSSMHCSSFVKTQATSYRWAFDETFLSLVSIVQQ